MNLDLDYNNYLTLLVCYLAWKCDKLPVDVEGLLDEMDEANRGPNEDTWKVRVAKRELFPEEDIYIMDGVVSDMGLYILNIYPLKWFTLFMKLVEAKDDD